MSHYHLPRYALLERVSKPTWCPRPAVAVVAGLQDARLLPRVVVVLTPMCRHSSVGIHAGLVQAYQLLRRHLKVVSNQPSNLPLSSREEADRVFVGREELVAPIATHLHFPGPWYAHCGECQSRQRFPLVVTGHYASAAHRWRAWRLMKLLPLG